MAFQNGAQVVLGLQRQHQQHENMFFIYYIHYPKCFAEVRSEFGSFLRKLKLALSSSIARPIVESFHSFHLHAPIGR